ncbi:MAG: ParB/RepB/Spo0J family partition protein [Desulfovibrio sp.]|nr:ParB/RepB/Spo0J family partition protein [Desulfovibrio sp.]
MSLQNKGLGRGLDALFKPNIQEGEEDGSEGSPRTLPLRMIEPNPDQPRSVFSEDTLKELAASIQARGILQPIIARPIEPGRFQIVAGERRWRAAELAGLEEIPVIIREFDDAEAMIVALMENIQREDLNPIDKAAALQSIKDALGVNQEELAERVGLPRGTLSNFLRLLNLPEIAKKEVAEGTISMGHARCLAALPEESLVESLLNRMLEKNLTVREAEEAIGVWRTEGRFPWERDDEKKQKDPEIKRLAKNIGDALNCNARISGTVEKGRISLAYESNEQLFELLEKLGLTLEN